ncbi:MAG: hypothetical protein GYB64_11250 [Chloroflexi bacterium]|nr:hypothetical protein [Chloroflexota bacterium]
MTTTQQTGVSANSTPRFSVLRIASIVLVLGALGISAYLSYVKVFNAPMACVASPAFDCGTVAASKYSMFLGIPIAVWGLGVNLGLLGILLLEDRIALLQEYGLMLLFGILLFGTLYSIWLIVVQAAILGAFCPWCLAHEVIVFALFGIAIVRLSRDMQPA